jgi:hypothetical protein
MGGTQDGSQSISMPVSYQFKMCPYPLFASIALLILHIHTPHFLLARRRRRNAEKDCAASEEEQAQEQERQVKKPPSMAHVAAQARCGTASPLLFLLFPPEHHNPINRSLPVAVVSK